MLAEAKSSEVVFKSGKMSYIRLGHGQPLLLIPGFGSSFRDWNEDFVYELSQKFELFLVNIRGVGFSQSNDSNHSIESYASDILQFCDTLGLKTFGVLGHSMGGYVAQEIAIQAASRLTGMVLCSTRMGGPTKVMAAQWVIDSLTQEYTTVEEEEEASLMILVPENDRPRMREAFRRRTQTLKDCGDIEVPVETFRAQNQARSAWLERDRSDDYSRFKFSTLIMCGNEDVVIPMENSIELFRAFSSACLIRVPDAGHALIHQFPFQIAARISEFFKDH